ncbi:serine-rich adhesin for platelets-like [Daphnia carinata]|uniref:serine-rich adhesin for platelets-like n=1 Tax=Daphnia carinata TaxID=120202 RepID=UPI002580BA9F|nr:serine-rich adhesin for platelets-like [Daphnia carinata]
MASSVSSNGGGNNVMIRSKADSIGVAGGGHTTAMDERNTQTVVASNATTAMMATLAAGPEKAAATADDSAISFSEEEEEEDEEEDEEEEDDDDEEGEIDDQDEDDNRRQQSSPGTASSAAAFNAAAAAAAFQRQLLANFPMFHHATDGSSKLENDPSNPSAAMRATSSPIEHNGPNPFESYMAAAAAAAAANAEALFRHQRQLHNNSANSARLSEKRTAHDSGTDDNDVSIGGGKGADGSGSGQTNHQQLPSNKRRKQSKPVRISSDETQGPNDENAAMTAFLAAQTAAAAAALFHQNNPNASSEEEEEEEGALLHPNSSAASSAKRINGQYQQQMMDWARSAHSVVAGSNEGEQEEGQIIRTSSGLAFGPIFDQQLANRLLMAGPNSSSSAARNFAELFASGGGPNGKGFPIPAAAYGANWNQQQQQMMMNIMSMNRNGAMLDDGELSRGSSHCSGSPTGGLAAGGNHSTSDAKRNDENGERSHADSPFALRHMFKYGSTSGAFFPPGGPSISSAHNPFLFPFLSSSSAGNSPLANQSMGRGGLVGSPGGLGGSIRIFNPDAYCELCNKEFCNKYFLKTHKANKHGIFVDNVPTTSGGGGTPSVTPDGRITCPTSIATTPTASSVHQPLPFSVSSSPFGPPSLSLTVGAMTYPMHPPSTELAGMDAISYSPVATTSSSSPSKSIYPSVGASSTSAATLSTTATTTIPSLAPITTPTSGMSGMSGGAGLMDFFPMWPSQTTTPPVTSVNSTMVTSSMMPSLSTSSGKPPHLPGIVNPEAYCDLCQKEFCNKYFLKRHKAKMHGIVPPEGSTAPSGASAPSSGGGGSSSHKRSRSHSSKAASSAAVDLIKIPLTPAVGPVTSPARSFNLSAGGSETVLEHIHPPSTSGEDPNAPTPFNLMMQSGGGGGPASANNNETGASAAVSTSSASAKMDSNSSAGQQRQDGHSLSLLKIPTPSLSAMFSSPPMDGHPARVHHSKTPCSSSSGGANAVAPPPQQMFTPERLRQMGVINTEAFCEICCKEFCNKYFLRTHKYKKHGIGSMPEQPQQSQQQPSNPSASSESSTGMVRQHHYNNNNNNNNKRGGPSPTGSAKQANDIHAEQKTPLNLVSTPPVTTPTTTTTPTTNGGQADGGMPLTCDLCQRPFQSAYLLHMHRTYFHNQPPPAADESIHENDTSVTGMDEDTPSDNEEEEQHFNNSPRPASVAVKSEPEGRNADEDRPVSTGGGEANNSSGGITISADLQKLQSMIMELNGSPSAAAAAAASMVNEGDRRRCWTDGPVKNASNNIIQPNSAGNNEPGNHYISGSGGGIVKIVNPASSDPSDLTSSSSSICHLCGNKDFLTPSFLQIHMQNYHGINAGGGVDPSAAAMEAAVAAAASQLGLDRLLDFGPPPAPSSTSGHHHHHGGKRSGGGRSTSSASPAANRSFCQICNKELCNKYFMKTHMLKMHGIHLEASGGGAQIGGVQCDICHKELCSKYFLKVHKQNTHGIGFTDHEMLPNGLSGTMLKEAQHPAVMDLSFHQQQMQHADGSNSPSKSSAVSECCPLCPKKFKSTKALKAHLNHDHSGSSGTSSATACCYICNQQFGDVVALQVHLIKSHASHLMDHQTPPPQVPASGAATTSGNNEQTNQGCLLSSPSPKTSPTSFQRSNYCDFSAASTPAYLFANERPGQVADGCPPMPGLVPASNTANSRPSSAVGRRSSPPANQQKIQCPLCGQQLPLEQFQTHLMAHQLPINFLHTLMPPSASAGTTAPASHADEEQDDLAVVNQQQGQAKRRPAGRRRRRYRCSVCSRKFATRQLCLTHILQRHPPSMRSHNCTASKGSAFGLSSPTSPASCQTVQSQQRTLTCPRCGYATRQPQLLRLHLRTQQCIPVVARNPDLQQLPPYLAVPTSTASVGNAVGHPSRLAAIVNNKQGLGVQSVQGQHAHRQDFVLQAFLLTQPDADKSSKSRRSAESNQDQANGHYDHDDSVSDRLASKSNGNRVSQESGKQTSDDQQDGPATANNQGDNGEQDEQEEGQNQSCNFIPSLILLPVNRRIANPLSLTFSLTPA